MIRQRYSDCNLTVDFGLQKTFAKEISTTISRKVLVELTVPPLYHCISRSFRRAFLCGKENSRRKQWIEDRLQELVQWFAIDVAGFSFIGGSTQKYRNPGCSLPAGDVCVSRFESSRGGAGADT